MEHHISDASPAVKKLKQACLPFKPCNPSSLTPVGNSTGKKRRVNQSNSGGRCAAKNLKVETKKAMEKLDLNLSDDKVVSSSCEVDCSNAVSVLTASKFCYSSRNSLDNFVHTTQKLEITTSSKDGDDLVDLTADDECVSEVAAVSSISVPFADDNAAAVSTATTDKDERNVSHVIATYSADARKNESEAEVVDDENKENYCAEDIQGSSECPGYRNATCTGSDKVLCPSDIHCVESTSACVDSQSLSVAETVPHLDASVDKSAVDVHDRSDASISTNSADCISDSQCNISVSEMDDDVGQVETCKQEDSGECETDKQLKQASVVLHKLPDENLNVMTAAPNCDEKHKVTETVTGVTNQEEKASCDTNNKPKIKLSREEKQRLKEEKEKLRTLAKEQREKEKQDAKIQKEQERAEKQKEKDQKKKEKEEERLKKLELQQEDRKKKQELKAEEKKKKEERKSLQENKASEKEKELMQKFFFAPKETLPVKVQDVKTGPFMDFEVKKDMRIASSCRLQDHDSVNMARHLDALLISQDPDSLYIEELKSGSHRSRSSARTWPSRENAANSDLIVLPSRDCPGSFMRAKLLQFHENYRPAYYGTWRKHSSIITARRPLQRDTEFFAYDVDSDEEWEEEEPGESLSHSEGEEDEENDGDPDDEGDGFFVPHGYLSEDEGCNDDDEEERKVSPEKMKDQLLAKMKNWEAEVLGRKCDILQPVVIGISWWMPDTESDPTHKKLQDFQAMLLEETPFETVVTTADQPVKTKSSKESKGKATVFIPVPDTGLPDLARLVHGNSRSIHKLVREFCEYWRSTNLAKPAAENSTPDENAPVYKVSKRKVEAKIREIAVYEFRPHCYKYKLWYVNDKTLEELKLSLPVPTEWKWMTLVSTKPVETADIDAAKDSPGPNVQPSPTSAGGTIKSFMSPATPNGPQQQSSLNHNACATPNDKQSPSESDVSAKDVQVTNSANSKTPGSVLAFSTPCSRSKRKKYKLPVVKRHSLPEKQQSCLLFGRKRLQPTADDDCVTLVSSVKAADVVSNAEQMAGHSGVTGNLDTSDAMKIPLQQPADDDDCMIVDSCVIETEPAKSITTTNAENVTTAVTVPQTDQGCSTPLVTTMTVDEN